MNYARGFPGKYFDLGAWLDGEPGGRYVVIATIPGEAAYSCKLYYTDRDQDSCEVAKITGMGRTVTHAIQNALGLHYECEAALQRK